MYQEMLKKSSAAHHSPVIYPNAESQRMTNKESDYSALEYHGEHDTMSIGSLHVPGIQTTDKSMNVTKKLAQKPESCMKPFNDSKNIEMTKVLDFFPMPKATSETPAAALNIRSGISPLIYCKQSSVEKSVNSCTSPSDKSSSLETKVNSMSIIISQRNCIVAKRREERQSFEDKLTEVEEQFAHGTAKKKLKRVNSHVNKSDTPSEPENVIENASQNLEPGKTSKHEKHLVVYKSAKHHGKSKESVKLKHASGEFGESLENKCKNEWDYNTGKHIGERISAINEVSGSSAHFVNKHRHDSKLNQGLKAETVSGSSDENKHSNASEDPNKMSSNFPEKMSVKHTSKAIPLDYGNLYLYCIKKSYRLKHVNWNQSSESLLRMLKKKYKSLKLMFPRNPALCLKRCPVNRLCKGGRKQANINEQTMISQLPMEKESELSSTRGDDQKEEGSLVDPRVMSLSKTLLSSNNGKVGQDKTFKKHTPLAHDKRSQKSKTQLHKKISKPDWSKLKEKLKAVSSKPIKKMNDGLVVEKNLIKMPVVLGNLFITQVPQFRIPKKSSSKSKTEGNEPKPDNETACKNESDTTFFESGEEPAADMKDVSDVCNDGNTVSNTLENTTAAHLSENEISVKSNGILQYTAENGDYASPDKLNISDVALSDDKINNAESFKLPEENFMCCELTEACDIIPDLHAEKQENVIKDDGACDISPPVLEKAIDTSSIIQNQEINCEKEDNKMMSCYDIVSETIAEESKNSKHVSRDGPYDILPVHTCNTEQEQDYSNFEIIENPDDSEDMCYSDDFWQNMDDIQNVDDAQFPDDMYDSTTIDNEGLPDLVITDTCSLNEDTKKAITNCDKDEIDREYSADSPDTSYLQLDVTTRIFDASEYGDKKSSKSDEHSVPLVDYMCDTDTSEDEEAVLTLSIDKVTCQPDVSNCYDIDESDIKQPVWVEQNEFQFEDVSGEISHRKPHQNSECINEIDHNDKHYDLKSGDQSEDVNSDSTSDENNKAVDSIVLKNSDNIDVETGNDLARECYNDVAIDASDDVCEEDYISDIDSYTYDKISANEDIKTLFEKHMAETSGNVLDDADDSCSLPDIEPPTVQIIDHRVMVNATTPSNDTSDPPRNNTELVDVALPSNNTELVDEALPSNNTELVDEALPSNNTSLTDEALLPGDRLVKSYIKLTTKSKTVKSVTASEKVDKMEFSEERLARDFPNHNWLFNKYNFTVPESSEEHSHKLTKKKKKELSRLEKMSSADNEFQVSQKADRVNFTLNSRLSDCLQGFKGDKNNVETNIKFGWNKKFNKRQLNAFGKGFQNKVNPIKNVLEVDSNDSEEQTSITDEQHNIPETKLMKEMAIENTELCKTVKIESKQPLSSPEHVSVALNLCKQNEPEYEELNGTGMEVICPNDQGLHFQKKQMPASPTHDNKLGDNGAMIEIRNMVVDSRKEYSDDNVGDIENMIEIREDVKGILMEMSDSVVETTERNAQSTEIHSEQEMRNKQSNDDNITTPDDDLSDVDDDCEDDEESRLEIDESVEDPTLRLHTETCVLYETKSVTETTESSDILSSPVKASSSSTYVTISTDISTTESKQAFNKCEDRSQQVETNSIKTDNAEVNFRPRSKPPVQLVHPQVHKPVIDPDSSPLPSVQEVHAQHTTFYQGAEVQSTRPINQASWTSSDRIPSPTTKVTSVEQSIITPSLTSTNSNQTVVSRVFSNALLQDGPLSNRRTDSSTVLATSVSTYGSGLVIPIQPFMKNVNSGANQNVSSNQPNVQNTGVYDNATPLSIVLSDSQTFLPNYAGKGLNSSPGSSAGIVHAAVQKQSLDENHGPMLITQSGSLPLQRGLNLRPPPLLILPKSQVPPLQSKQAQSGAMVPAKPSVVPLTAQEIPFHTSTMTENYATPTGNDRKLFIPSTNIMKENSSSSTRDISVDFNQSNNSREPEDEDDVDDEIKKQMEELDAEIKRKECEQEEMRRKKLELLDKMKQAKLASKSKLISDANSGTIINETDLKIAGNKCELKETDLKLETVSCHQDNNMKQKYSGNMKDENTENVESCKDIVLTAVSTEVCNDVSAQKAPMEVSSINTDSKVHNISNEDLSVTVTDGVISITDNRKMDVSTPELSGEDSVLDLALSTNILVTDRDMGVENETGNLVFGADNMVAQVPNEVHTDYSKEFIEDIRVVNPFTGEYDDSAEMETESEAQLDLSMKTNLTMNENKQTLNTNECTTDKCEKLSLKGAEIQQLSTNQEIVNKESLCVSQATDNKSENDTKIYSEVNDSDTALNLVTVVRQSSVNDDQLHGNSNQENETISSLPTSTKSNTCFTTVSFSSMTSSESITTSSINISYNSGLSLVSHCSSSTPSGKSGSSIITPTYEAMTISASSVKAAHQSSHKESKLSESNRQSDKLSNSKEPRDLLHTNIECKDRDNARELVAITGEDIEVDNDEPLNLMNNTNKSSDKISFTNSDKIGDNKSDEKMQCPASSISKNASEEAEDFSLSSSIQTKLPLNVEKNVDKNIAPVPLLPIASEPAAVTQSNNVHPINPIRPDDTNSVQPSSSKVMYIHDKLVSVQNVNGALRLATPIRAVVPDRHSRLRERFRKNKSKFSEIRAAHTKSPIPRKLKNSNPEPAHIMKIMSRETMKKINRALFEVPSSIRQSSPYFRRLVPNYLSPSEWTKASPKLWQKRPPKPAHSRRPFGIAGHLIVSASRRRKRTCSEQNISAPTFYSLPATPTTPPSAPPRVSSASEASDNPGSYKRLRSDSLELCTSSYIASPEKNWDHHGAPIRAHCRPRSSANKEQFYETSVLRPPSIHKNRDNLVAEKNDIIDLTRDVVLISESVEKKSTKNPAITERTIQEELNHAMSKRQRLDNEVTTNKGQLRNESKPDDSGSKAQNNRVDPEIIRKKFMKPPPPYTGRQRMPVLAQFPRRPPLDQPRMANKTVPYPQVYSSEIPTPVAPRMQYSARAQHPLQMATAVNSMAQNPLQMATAVNSMTQNQRWSPTYRRITAESNFPTRPVIPNVQSPEFTTLGHGTRRAPVAIQSPHEYVTSQAPDTVMVHTPSQQTQRQSLYPSQRGRHQPSVDTRFQQHGVISQSGYPPTSLGYTPTSHGYPQTSHGYPHTALGYPPTSPVVPHATDTSHVYPGGNAQFTQHALHRQPTMVSQNPNISLSADQSQHAGPGYPNPPYPSQVHQLLQKPSSAHQGMVAGVEPAPQMYPPINPGARSPHVTPRGEAVVHVSSSVAHPMAPRGFMAQGYPREMSKGQLYPTTVPNPYLMVNRGGSSQMTIPNDMSLGRRELSPNAMLPRQSPGLTNVESMANSSQRLVGQYPMQGSHSATHAADEHPRGPRLTEEQQLQSMQRIRAQHIRTQQMQGRSPSGIIPVNRFPDPVAMQQQQGGGNQANPVINQGSRFKLQQHTISPDAQQTAQIPILGTPSPTDMMSGSADSMLSPRTVPQGQQMIMLAGNRARGQGQVPDYAQINNDSVMIQNGSQMMQNSHNNYALAQEVPSIQPGAQGMRGRSLLNSGQSKKSDHMPGHNVKGLSSHGNQTIGQVIQPPSQSQPVQYHSANNSNNLHRGHLMQGEGHTRPVNMDMPRQDHAGMVQGQGSPVFQQKSPTTMAFIQQSVHQGNMGITHNRPILPKPTSSGNNYVQNSQSLVSMTTDLRHPQQTHSVPSTQHSPQTPSTESQHSPQKCSTQGQSEGQMESELPHLQQVHGACFMCGKYSLYLCSNCKEIWYCSPECQLTHWQTHAAECVGPST